ncbi:uncharacterized protein LOC131050589 [Cryptomeria japonica]|uniref:uncharacterized protein LOC131050589 n=1 Tax=Cryptomeria japonica TaxID=3369 RepID=UPI0027D9CF6D|nr:uncharacterized protein LOC131050589 [Cryptomeria japonica]
MLENEAIKYAALHLDGVAHEWWHHGQVTLGHNQIVTYVEFTEKLIDRFDSKDPELHLKDLTQLKQFGTAKQYISEFEKLVVLVTEISERHKIVIFIDGLSDSLKGHRCSGKGKIHYIEVMLDSDDEENVDPNIETIPQNTESGTSTKHGEGVIAFMIGTPHYNIFIVRGVLNGQRVVVMLDSGSTHNFIDAALVEKCGSQTEKHEGFDVRVVGGTNLSSTH